MNTNSRNKIGLSSDEEPKKSGMKRTQKNRRSAEPLSRNDDAYPRRKRTSCISTDECVESRILETQKGGKLSIHHNGDLSVAELLFRTIISVNHLSIHGAIEDWCGKLAQQI